MAKKRKNPIKYKIELNEEQQQVKEAICNNQIVVITGKAGTGKTILTALTGLDLMFKKHIKQITVTRPAVEVGASLGYLKGDLGEKFSPYTDAFMDNLYKCYDASKIDKHIDKGQIKGTPVQFIRGKTIDSKEVLFVEEAQNLTKTEILAVMTRLGRKGRLVISGDNGQTDIRKEKTGLSFALELAENIEAIKHYNLVTNHRSELVGEILNYNYKTTW